MMTTVRFPKPVAKAKTPKPLRRTSRLEATATLKRSRIKRRRPRRLDRAGSDIARLDWVRGEVCMVFRDAGHSAKCEGRIEAHHAGKNPGVAMKAGDDTAVPLCRKHHRQLTDHSGSFRAFDRAYMRAIQDRWIAETQSRYLSHGGRRS